MVLNYVKQMGYLNIELINFLHACDKNLNEVIRSLEHDSCLAIEWFENNYMKQNKDKCKVLIAGHKYEHMWPDVGNNRISEKMLGILIDNSLKFDNYVAEICRKVSRKITALARLTKTLPLAK